MWCPNGRATCRGLVADDLVAGRPRGVVTVRRTAQGVEPVGSVRATCGEGPLWDDARGLLRWVDIPSGHVHATDPVTGETVTHALPPPVSGVWPTTSGQLAVAAGLSVLILDQDGVVVDVLATLPDDEDMRFNDGLCDSTGQLWIGTMPLPPGGGRCGALWRLESGGAHHLEPVVALTDVALSNGLAWSPGGETLYFVDTLTQRIDAYDVTAAGLGERRTLADVAPADGVPDGLAVDAEGGVWVALAGGGALRRYAPSGELLEEVALPVSHPTSCTFGGPDLSQLFVTTWQTAPVGVAIDAWAGRLLRLSVGVAGLPNVEMQMELQR